MASDEPLEPEVVQVFDEFWASIVCPGGNWDLDQVKRELHDYHTCIVEVPKVYMEITGHLLSKPNYLASEVIAVHDERCGFLRDLREMVGRIKLAIDADSVSSAGALLAIEEIMNDYVDVDECLTP